jgi:glutamate synthase (ferredoxin)
MTGGKVVILGKTGRNFAAGMSGGIAYIFDADGKFGNGLCNMEMVEFDAIFEDDEKDLKQMIKNHFKYTNSDLAYRILDDWENNLSNFVKVMPTDYKKALMRLEMENNIKTATV